MGFQLIRQVRDEEVLRKSFFALAMKVFHLSFEDWYDKGYWTDAYLPYVFAEENRVVANVSVNRMTLQIDGQQKNYLQLGTVMTDPAYRGRGLARKLIETILEEWRDQCDGIYLFANRTVLDFYPKFGFRVENLFQCAKEIVPATSTVYRLDMEKPADFERLMEYYRKNNPFSRLTFWENPGLLLFYCADFLKNQIYYLPQKEAVVIGEFEKEKFLCYDIYCDKDKNMDEILSALAREDTRTVIFGFTPKDETGCTYLPADGEDTFFLLNGKENPFAGEKLFFPLLSHA